MPKLSLVVDCFMNNAMAVGYTTAEFLMEKMAAITRDLRAHHDKMETIKAQRVKHKLNSKIRMAG